MEGKGEKQARTFERLVKRKERKKKDEMEKFLNSGEKTV
jgi:hypothetical protein